MYLTEETFPHLREAAEKRQRRELEYDRIALERPKVDTMSAAGRRGLRERLQTFRTLAHLAPTPISHR
jgi:hypothetical protein